MSLSDIMSAAGLSGYAVVAMLLFIAAFLAIVTWIFSPRRRRELEARKTIPFDDVESPDPVTRGEQR